MKKFGLALLGILFCSFVYAQSIPFPGPGGIAGPAVPATVTYTATAFFDVPGTNPVNFTSFNIGTASADRYVMIGISERNSGATGVSAVTINGVSAVQKAAITSSGDDCTIWGANVTSGTSVTVSVTSASTTNRIVIGGWELHNLTGAGAVTSTASTTTNGGTMTLASVVSGGVAIGVTGIDAVTSYTWTGLTLSYSTASAAYTSSGAALAFPSGGSSVNVAGTAASGTIGPCGVAASFR